MHHQTMGNYEGVPLLALNTINAKQDDMNEYRYLMQADLINEQGLLSEGNGNAAQDARAPDPDAAAFDGE